MAEPRDPKFEQALNRANSLVGQGKLQEAINLLEQLIEHEPQNLELYRQVAVLSDRTGDFPKAVNIHLRWAAVCDHLGLHDDALKLYNQVLSVVDGGQSIAILSTGQKAIVVLSGATACEKKGFSKEKIRELIGGYRPEIEIQMGRIFLQKKMTDEAIKHLKGALDATAGTHDYRVHTLLGIAYMQKNMDKEAIGEFQEVVRLAPNEAAFAYEKLGEIFHRAGKPSASTIVWFRNSGDLYYRNEQFDDAIRVYGMILSFEQRNKDVLNRLADIYMQREMLDQAVATWRDLAQIYTDEGLLDKVIILYEKMTDLNPNDQESWARLLEIYRSILQRDGSNLSVRLKLIKLLTVGGDLKAVVPEYIALANAYVEKGVFDEAFQVIQKLLELDARNVAAREMLGDIHMRREEKEEALKEYLEVIRIYTEAGDEEKRLQFNQKLMSLFPHESGVQYEMARSLREQGSYEKALYSIQNVLEQDPTHVQALTDASDILLTMGRAAEARDMYQRILEIEPDRTDVRMTLFESHLQAGEIEAATAQLGRLASALQEKGLFRDAEMLYRSLMNYYPDSPEIRLQICQLRLQQGDVDFVVREYLLLANMFIRRAVLDRAAEMYAMILQHRPDCLNAHHKLGRVLGRLGQTSQALGHLAIIAKEYLRRNLMSEAIAVLRESLEIDPANIELRERLTELLVRALRIEEATTQYQQLIRGLLKAGRFDEASLRIKDVISLQPLHLDLRLELAGMAIEFNHLKEGQALLEDLISAYQQKGQTTKIVDLHVRMAQVYRAQNAVDMYWQTREHTIDLYRQDGRNADALVECQEIVEEALRAGEIERARKIFTTLVDLYILENRADDGISMLERLFDGLVRDGDPKVACVVRDFLIQLVERKGDKVQASRLLLSIAGRARESEDNEAALSLFGRAYDTLVTLGDIDEAARVQFIRIKMLLRIGTRLGIQDIDPVRGLFNDLRSLRPASIEDHTRYAELLCEHECFAEALPVLVELADRDFSNADARVRLAVTYARLGDIARSAACARSLLSAGLLERILAELERPEKRGSDAESLLRLGAFYEEMGFFEDALREYQRAARIPSHRLESLNRMAFLFRRAGYLDIAIRQCIRILEQPTYDDEELLETRYSLAQMYQESGRYREALSMFNECSAVRLRYRDVAERIEEVTALVGGGTSRAAVIPLTPPREESRFVGSTSSIVSGDAQVRPPAPMRSAARASQAPSDVAVPAPPAAQPSQAPSDACEAPLTVEEPAVEKLLDSGDDDVFLEGPPPDLQMG